MGETKQHVPEKSQRSQPLQVQKINTVSSTVYKAPPTSQSENSISDLNEDDLKALEESTRTPGIFSGRGSKIPESRDL